MSVYDCAYVCTQFEGSFIGWASFQGLRLLELPGNHLFVALFGLEEVYNTDPNLLIPFRIGLPVVVMFVLGMVVGFLWRPMPPAGRQKESSEDANLLAQVVLILSLAGVMGFGFLLGFLAFVVGAAVVSQPTFVRKPGCVCASLGMVIGAFDVVAWTLGLAIQLSL